FENFNFDLEKLNKDLQEVQHQNKKNQEDEKAKLKIEIESLKKRIEENKKSKKDTREFSSILNEPINLFTDQQKCLRAENSNTETDLALNRQLEAFKEGIKELKQVDAFAGEIGQELFDDI